MNFTFLYVTVSTLKPTVGMVVTDWFSLSLYRMATRAGQQWIILPRVEALSRLMGGTLETHWSCRQHPDRASRCASPCFRTACLWGRKRNHVRAVEGKKEKKAGRRRSQQAVRAWRRRKEEGRACDRMRLQDCVCARARVAKDGRQWAHFSYAIATCSTSSPPAAALTEGLAQ